MEPMSETEALIWMSQRRKVFKITFQLVEGKHYHDCQDTITHPLVVEAFKYGDQNGKGYNAIQWEDSIYEAELVDGEVFVGDWIE